MATKVRAKVAGFYLYYREPGDEFEVADGTKLGSWMQPLDTPKAGTKGGQKPAEPPAKDA